MEKNTNFPLLDILYGSWVVMGVGAHRTAPKSFYDKTFDLAFKDWLFNLVMHNVK